MRDRIAYKTIVAVLHELEERWKQRAQALREHSAQVRKEQRHYDSIDLLKEAKLVDSLKNELRIVREKAAIVFGNPENSNNDQ